jgi:CxxC motif-containing protein (DUF1111 family)
MRILKYSFLVVVELTTIVGLAFAQSGAPNMPVATDPGVRNSSIGAGGPLPDLSTTPGGPEFFDNGQTRFEETEVVSGGANNGLGPRFNLNQCSACHAQPAVGGSSPNVNQYPFIGVNPESQVLVNDIAFSPNTIPSFVTKNGPVVEARFPFFIESGQVTTAADGGVHDLFTVTGNSLAQNCTLSQPNFTQAANLNDIIFRIPTPVFGAGFLENIGEDALMKFFKEEAGNNFGVSGSFNYNGNDGTIARFGWKAQNKSGLLFAGEAYNVEMGITNELFQNERPDPDEEHNFTGLPSGCINLAGIGYPEDITNFKATPGSNQFATNASIPSDIVMFAMFMRFLNQPTPSPNGYTTATTTVSASSIANGQTDFGNIGCAACHNPTFKTDASQFNEDLSGAAANLYSDVEIHHMGGLADNVMQGTAGGDQFRTAPLWGVGQRIFFLHDGRTTDLITAIKDHCLAPSGSFPTSEACDAEQNFESLSEGSQQDVLNFLRSL